MRRLWLLLLAALPLQGARAQLSYEATIRLSPEPQVSGLFGSTVVIHDMNADGFGDVIVSEPRKGVGHATSAGAVWILWGPTLEKAKKIVSSQPVECERLGLLADVPPSAQITDVDGDGHLDIVMNAIGWNSPPSCSGWTGRVHVFWGPDWSTDLVLTDPQVEHNMRFGFGILQKDVDGDGLRELLIGAPNATGVTTGLAGEGRIRIWPGVDLARRVAGEPMLLESPRNVPFPDIEQWFGIAIRSAPFDDDGTDDIWISADEVLTGDSGEGVIYVYDGATLDYVKTIPNPANLIRKFGDLRFKGDLTGDGVDDIVVSALQSKFVTPSPVEPDPFAGAVVVLAGPEYTRLVKTLWSPLPTKDALFGSKSYVLDMDGDGDLDVLVGDPGTHFDDVSAVRIFHGPDFEQVQSLGPAEPGHSQMGSDLAAGDLDGDGLLEIVAGAIVINGQGSLHVFSPQTLSASTPTVSVSQGGAVELSLHMGGAKAGHAYLGLLTASGKGDGTILGKGSYLPLEPDLFTLMGLDFVGTPLMQGFGGQLGPDGDAQLVLDWPAGFATELAGLDLTFAVLTTGDGRPGACSSAVTVSLVP